MAKLAVIIPAYNEENIIAPLLESLERQTVKDFDIIVVSNNSTDGTMKIAKRFTKFVYNCPIQGSVPARNFAAKKARNRYIAFLDADSEVNADWAGEILASFAKDPSVKAVTGCGTYIEPRIAYSILYNVFAEICNCFIALTNAFGKPYLTSNNFAIDRSIFLELGGLDNFIIEDHWFSEKFAKKRHKAVYNNNMRVRYSSRRFHADGFWKTVLLWAKGRCRKIPFSEYHAMRPTDT